MSGDSTAYGGYGLQFAITVVALWASLNLGFNFFNSYALRPESKGGFGFGFPFFYSGCHMIASFVGVNLIFKIKPDLNTLNKEQWRAHWKQLVSLSLLMVANIGCNNVSLVYIGLSTNQIIKSITPLPTMCLAYFIEDKRYSWVLVVDVLLQVIGAVLSVPFGDSMAEPLGLMAAFVSMLAAASKPVVASVLMKDSKKSGLTPLALVWYDSLFAIFWFFIIALSLPERSGVGAYMAEKPALGLTIIAAGSTMALAYNIVVFYLTKVTSALTNVVLANIKQVLVIGFAAVFIDHITRVTNIIGMVIFFAASFTYSYLTFTKRSVQQPSASALAAAEKGPMVAPAEAPTERTDLIKK